MRFKLYVFLIALSFPSSGSEQGAPAVKGSLSRQDACRRAVSGEALSRQEALFSAHPLNQEKYSEAYLQNISRGGKIDYAKIMKIYPALPPAIHKRMIELYKESGNERVLKILLFSNFRLIHRIIQKIRQEIPVSISPGLFNDYWQEGAEALLRAIDKFNLSFADSLVTTVFIQAVERQIRQFKGGDLAVSFARGLSNPGTIKLLKALAAEKSDHPEDFGTKKWSEEFIKKHPEHSAGSVSRMLRYINRQSDLSLSEWSEEKDLSELAPDSKIAYSALFLSGAKMIARDRFLDESWEHDEKGLSELAPDHFLDESWERDIMDKIDIQEVYRRLMKRAEQRKERKPSMNLKLYEDVAQNFLLSAAPVTQTELATRHGLTLTRIEQVFNRMTRDIHMTRDIRNMLRPGTRGEKSSAGKVNALPETLREKSSAGKVDALPEKRGEKSSAGKGNALPETRGEESSAGKVDALSDTLREKSSAGKVNALPETREEKSFAGKGNALSEKRGEKSSAGKGNALPETRGEESSAGKVDALSETREESSAGDVNALSDTLEEDSSVDERDAPSGAKTLARDQFFEHWERDITIDMQEVYRRLMEQAEQKKERKPSMNLKLYEDVAQNFLLSSDPVSQIELAKRHGLTQARIVEQVFHRMKRDIRLILWPHILQTALEELFSGYRGNIILEALGLDIYQEMMQRAARRRGANARMALRKMKGDTLEGKKMLFYDELVRNILLSDSPETSVPMTFNKIKLRRSPYLALSNQQTIYPLDFNEFLREITEDIQDIMSGIDYEKMYRGVIVRAVQRQAIARSKTDMKLYEDVVDNILPPRDDLRKVAFRHGASFIEFLQILSKSALDVQQIWLKDYKDSGRVADADYDIFHKIMRESKQAENQSNEKEISLGFYVGLAVNILLPDFPSASPSGLFPSRLLRLGEKVWRAFRDFPSKTDINMELLYIDLAQNILLSDSPVKNSSLAEKRGISLSQLDEVLLKVREDIGGLLEELFSGNMRHIALKESKLKIYKEMMKRAQRTKTAQIEGSINRLAENHGVSPPQLERAMRQLKEDIRQVFKEREVSPH